MLEEFDFTLKNISSVTTDNGANMLKLMKLLKHEQEMFDSENESESEDYSFLEKYSDEFHLEGEELFSVEDNNFKLVDVHYVAHTL